MFEPLETKRLLLKNIGFDDAEFLYREFSTDEVNAYLYDSDPISSIEEANTWVTFYTRPEPRNQHRWILVLKQTGEKIGTCGVHCWDRESASAEVGYDLQPAYWRKGYMSEAMQALCAFARDRMEAKSLILHIAEDNIASIKTAEKFGFRKTGQTYYEEFHGNSYLHFVYQLVL